MVDSPAVQPDDVPPMAFIEQVKAALEHLYDMEYLERHPLVWPAAQTGETPLAGQRLRWALSAALEALNPGPRTPFAAPPARLYNLLSLRYVERHTVLQAAQELNLSERQAHRDCRRSDPDHSRDAHAAASHLGTVRRSAGSARLRGLHRFSRARATGRLYDGQGDGSQGTAIDQYRAGGEGDDERFQHLAV